MYLVYLVISTAFFDQFYIDDLVQDSSNSHALGIELQ